MGVNTTSNIIGLHNRFMILSPIYNAFILNNYQITAIEINFTLALPAHFHDVDDDLSDHNVGKIMDCPKF